MSNLSMFQSIKKHFKYNIVLEPVDLVIVFFYYLFSVLLILSLAGLFKNYYIFVSLVFFLIVLVIFRKRIAVVPIKNLKRGLFLLFVVLLIFVGCLLFNGQVSGDAVNYWLPLARSIVRDSAIPDLLLDASSFLTSRPPFLPLLFAGTFSFLGFNEIFALWIPFFFSFLTLIFLCRWCKLKKIKEKYIKFIPLLFLTNPLVLSFGWDLLQESIILFFFVAFFYYFEKYKEKDTKLNLLLLLFSFILAVASKEIGLFLIIPLAFLFFKKEKLKNYKKYLFFLTAFPIFGWWIRNYLVFDNPVFHMLSGIFKGRYAEFLTFSNSYAYVYDYSLKNIFERFSPEMLIQFLVILPLVVVTLYMFFKKKKFEYVLLILTFFLIGQFWAGTTGELRYYYPFLGIFLVYFLSGIEKINSRKILSVIFFISLFGLLSTSVVLSNSSFIGPIEAQIQSLSILAGFIYNYKFIVSIILTIFFYFFLSKNRDIKYLILLMLCFYSLKTPSVQISWLNTWLPILGLMIMVFAWNLLQRLDKKKIHEKITIAIAVIILFINIWGLNIGYYLANNRFPYPDLKGFNILPQAGEKIKEIEGENKDFYILTDQPRYLSWYYDYKEVDASVSTFNYITKLKYRNTMTSEELRDLLQEAKIKYIIKSTTKTYWDYFFEKVENRPELFKPILKQDNYTLWTLNNLK
ncbi:MAG: glycosyltransferase family 39 protein [Patescibacteria group bacterium]